MRNHILGTRHLLQLLFKQHRLKVFYWLIGIIGLSLLVAAVYPTIYTNQEEVIGFGFTMSNPAMRAMLGANYPAEEFTVNIIYASEMLLFTTIAVSIMNINLMTTSTRVDEEEGRLEIVQSLPVGKWSYLLAGTLFLLLINVVLIGVLTAGLLLAPNAEIPLEEALLYSSIMGVTGLFFAGFTAVGAQLFETSRDVNMWSYGFLMLAYIVRAIGDVQNETFSLFSPLGWTTRTSVFYENDWLPVVALLGAYLVLSLLSLVLHSQRDMFSGILPTRVGKTRASSFLKTKFGLVWYLEKNKIIGWAILLFLLSMAFGSILGEFETYFSDLDIIEAFFTDIPGDSMLEQLIIYTAAIMSLFSLFPIISVLLGLKGEEKKGHMEHLYSRAVPRSKMLGSYYALAVLTGIVMQLSIAAGFYLSSSQVLENTFDFSLFLQMTFLYLPALWVVIGLVTILVGALPRFTSMIWGYFVFLFVQLYLGSLLEFPEWLNNLSVFYHIPDFPEEAINWMVLGILSGIAILLSLIGFIGYNRRDIGSE